MHGGARKTTPGVRRSIWYRYTMSWSRLRYGYAPSRELCERLNPRRAAIVDPHYAKMLERAPQASPTSYFRAGEAWSVKFLLDTRLQQKEAVAGVTRQRRLAIQKKQKMGKELTDEESAVLQAVDKFDATSH